MRQTYSLNLFYLASLILSALLISVPASAATEVKIKSKEAVASLPAATETPALAPAPEATGPTKPPYLLKEGDVLEVSVWQEDSLRKELRVLPDGSITFPLVGRVEVAGLPSEAAEKKVAEKLKPYLSDPVVNVVISNINGNRMYVIGNVAKPGPVILDVPMTVLQVLSLAGGLGRFADENAIKILREGPNGVETLHVRYSDLIKAKDLSTNVQLKAGDTLLVP
jgi:polysaccharide export outer membrane protein